jgi:hypothetical protein
MAAYHESIPRGLSDACLGIQASAMSHRIMGDAMRIVELHGEPRMAPGRADEMPPEQFQATREEGVLAQARERSRLRGHWTQDRGCRTYQGFQAETRDLGLGGHWTCSSLLTTEQDLSPYISTKYS